jgi:Glycine zipper 2TM domain
MPNSVHVNEGPPPPRRLGRRDQEELRIMLKKFALSAAVAVSALTAMPAAADAQSRSGYYDRSGYDRSGYDRSGYGYRNDDRRYDRRYDARRYDRRYDNRRYDRGSYRHYARRCDSGTTGTIIGAVVGGLLGREIAGRGDRTVGTMVGGAVGALGGRAIDRGNCRR